MSIINESNQNELTIFLSCIDTIARINPSIVDEITTDKVLKELITKVVNRMVWLLNSYNQNALRVKNLSVSGDLVSELELCENKMKLIIKDIFASYSLYETYIKLAESRNLEIQTTFNITTVEKVLVDAGLLEKSKQI